MDLGANQRLEKHSREGCSREARRCVRGERALLGSNWLFTRNTSTSDVEVVRKKSEDTRAYWSKCRIA